MLILPRLYPIVDRQALEAHGVDVRTFARGLRDAGVRLVQYRDKSGAPREILGAAREIAEVFAGIPEVFPEMQATLILNDRADLAVLADWSGVHVGHRDLPPAEARRLVGAGRVLGVSTHTDEQVRTADASEADYIAVGPVFATSTKADAEPVIGLDGVRRARALTAKPLVAIGGITRETARSAIDAGADSVAVIGGLFIAGEQPGNVARDFLDILR